MPGLPQSTIIPALASVSNSHPQEQIPLQPLKLVAMNASIGITAGVPTGSPVTVPPAAVGRYPREKIRIPSVSVS
jgi:hypothetical protein